jgi:hypothetical protein
VDSVIDSSGIAPQFAMEVAKATMAAALMKVFTN